MERKRVLDSFALPRFAKTGATTDAMRRCPTLQRRWISVGPGARHLEALLCLAV